MTAKNEVTGDAIRSRPSTDKYRDGWDRIFLKDKKDPDPDDSPNENVLNEEVDSNER